MQNFMMFKFKKESNSLEHTGVKRRSGRYEWGSGEFPFQHEPWFEGFGENKRFIEKVLDYKSKGLSQKEIVEKLKLHSTTELRNKISSARHNMDKYNIAVATYLKDKKGLGNKEIGEFMDVPESTVRGYLKSSHISNVDLTDQTVDVLRTNADDKGFVDVGAGTEYLLGVSRDRMNKSLASLVDEGYHIYPIQVEQLGTKGQKTTINVLTPPETNYADVYANKDKIRLITDRYDADKGNYITDLNIEPPVNVNSKRMMVVYNEDGGGQKDGIIELRRGVEDLNLGGANFAQVRIAVDGTHYLKGIAMYSDDMPDGVDIRFNTSKHKDVPVFGDKDNSVLKPLKKDKDNPFGATIKPEEDLQLIQTHYIDSKGEKKLSALNIVNEEGSWSDWSKTLASQMLSKQPIVLIKKQLRLTYEQNKEEFDEIASLTNNTLKKKLLEEFADECDASAVHLKAAAMPRQGSYAILPINSLKPDEIYAPKYENGEKVVLIRYPHAGRFEMPELVVNNKNKEGINLLGNTMDGVGINYKTAAQLSGADFDGDTVVVIPNNKGEIKSGSPLKQLADFDPKEAYPYKEGIKIMPEKLKGREMGIISNLITDMTLGGKATEEEMARAVKHSMVVIDAVKHRLDYKLSEKENDIDGLKKKYQMHADGTYGGASTLISRSKSVVRVDERKEGKYITDENGKTKKIYVNPKTGEKLYSYTGGSYEKAKFRGEDGKIQTVNIFTNNKTGERMYKNPEYTKDNGKQRYLKVPNDAVISTIGRQIESTKMYEAKDAFELSSGTPQETAYASYANAMKTLGNEARKLMVSIPNDKREPSAAKLYSKEVASLNDKLKEALLNAPYERQAQLKANIVVAKKKEELGSDITSDDLSKLKGQTLAAQRVKVGAAKKRIDITPEEWNAIQAGAVSPSVLTSILNNSDIDKIKKYAMPDNRSVMTESKISRAKALEASGLTLAEIGRRLGVSASTVSRALKGVE